MRDMSVGEVTVGMTVSVGVSVAIAERGATSPAAAASNATMVMVSVSFLCFRGPFFEGSSVVHGNHSAAASSRAPFRIFLPDSTVSLIYFLKYDFSETVFQVLYNIMTKTPSDWLH